MRAFIPVCIALALLAACCDDAAVDVDTNAPRVEILSPAGGTVITAPVLIQAHAEDDDGVETVSFFVDSLLIGEDDAAPFELEWVPAEDGVRALTARASDFSGNEGVSAPVLVWELADPAFRPLPFSPPDKSIFDSPVAMTLSWFSVAGAILYEVQLSLQADLADPLVAVSLADTSLAVGELPQAWCFWRVRALDAQGIWHGWSTVFRFHVGHIFSYHGCGEGSDRGQSFLMDGDGGFVCTGYRAGEGKDLLLLKVNEQGQMVWSASYGGEGDESGQAVIDGHNNSYLVAGSLRSPAGVWSALLAKTSRLGEEQWIRHLGSIGEHRGESVARTQDGGYLLVGGRRAMGESYRLLLLKTDGDGTELWIATISVNYSEYGYNIQATDDGGFILTGYTLTYAGGEAQVWLAKLDADGALQWSRSFGGSAWDEGHSVLQLAEGGFLVAGQTESFAAGGSDVWLIRTDEQGNKLWSRSHGEAGWEYGNGLAPCQDGGFILTGGSLAPGQSASELLLLRVDEFGNELWSRRLNCYAPAEGAAVVQISGGGYVVLGHGTWPEQEDEELWLLKTDPVGFVFPPAGSSP